VFSGVGDGVVETEAVKLSELFLFLVGEEVVWFGGARSIERPPVFVCFALISDILDEFAPFDGTVTVNVDFGEEGNTPIQQI